VSEPSSIPVATTPPTQPAMPPSRLAAEARLQPIRHQAVQCGITYANAGLAVTVGQFWDAVDAFEQYIRIGTHQ
jgi:hypothetical protein